jgi:hypothetical protein
MFLGFLDQDADPLVRDMDLDLNLGLDPDPSILTSFGFLYLKNDVNVTSKSSKQCCDH